MIIGLSFMTIQALEKPGPVSAAVGSETTSMSTSVQTPEKNDDTTTTLYDSSAVKVKKISKASLGMEVLNPRFFGGADNPLSQFHDDIEKVKRIYKTIEGNPDIVDPDSFYVEHHVVPYLDVLSHAASSTKDLEKVSKVALYLCPTDIALRAYIAKIEEYINKDMKMARVPVIGFIDKAGRNFRIKKNKTLLVMLKSGQETFKFEGGSSSNLVSEAGSVNLKGRETSLIQEDESENDRQSPVIQVTR